MDIINKIINRGVAEIIERDRLESALRSGKKLRVKFGIDPTSPEIHLGHTAPLRKLRQFQDAGHKAVLIIGDFTAQIGDPSGRSETREPLKEREIKTNLKNYLKETGKILNTRNKKLFEVRHNNEWHKKGGLLQLLQIAQSATIQQVLRRADFRKRFDEDVDISVLELLYPVLQGYDSVAVRADVEIGGTDQKFNLLMGRRVQRRFGMKEQDIVTVPLIEGADGVRKMSKSFGNYIGLSEKPDDMFAKVMKVPDSLTGKYFELLTDVDPPQKMDPYESKTLLAETIVGMYHSPSTAKKAREEFVRVFSKKEAPKEGAMPTATLNKNASVVLNLVTSGIAPSKSGARRLVDQGAIRIDNAAVTDPDQKVTSGKILKVGKHRFFRIVWK